VGDFRLYHSFKESAGTRCLSSDTGTWLWGEGRRNCLVCSREGMMGAAAGDWACRLRLNHLQFRSRFQEIEIIIFAFGTRRQAKSQDVHVKWKSASIDVSRSSAAKPPRRSAASAQVIELLPEVATPQQAFATPRTCPSWSYVLYIPPRSPNSISTADVASN
jgi:hypothetical protein